MGRSRSSGHPPIHSQLQASLGYLGPNIKRLHCRTAHSVPCSGATQNVLLSVPPKVCLSPCLCPLPFLAVHLPLPPSLWLSPGQNHSHLFLAEHHLLRPARDHVEAKMPAPEVTPDELPNG